MADVVLPMPPNRISIHVEFLGKGVETGTAGTQQFDPPSLGMTANLATVTYLAHAQCFR